MGKISYFLFVISLSLAVVSSCCSKPKKQSSGFYALGLLDISEEYITTDSSYVYEHYYISRYIYLNENDSMFLIISDKHTDSLFSITCNERERRLFKEYTTLSVNDLKKNPFDDDSPCCSHPVAVYVKNDTLQSPGLISGCAINIRGLNLDPINRKFISDNPTFAILEKRYLMEGIIQTAIFRSEYPMTITHFVKFQPN
jgi:hypothetical protein